VDRTKWMSLRVRLHGRCSRRWGFGSRVRQLLYNRSCFTVAGDLVFGPKCSALSCAVIQCEVIDELAAKAGVGKQVPLLELTELISQPQLTDTTRTLL